MKQNVLIDFVWNIRSKLIYHKKKHFERFQSRNDYHNMLMVDNKDKNQMTHMIKGLFKSDDEKAEKSEIE